jgi:hypothetical protein
MLAEHHSLRGVQFGMQAAPMQRAKLLYSGHKPPQSIAYGVNRQGQIVGISPGKSGFPFTAFFYDGNAEPDDLLESRPKPGKLVASRRTAHY